MKDTTKALQHERDYENGGYLGGQGEENVAPFVFFFKKGNVLSLLVGYSSKKTLPNNLIFFFFFYIVTFISHTKSQLSLRKETQRGTDT